MQAQQQVVLIRHRTVQGHAARLLRTYYDTKIKGDECFSTSAKFKQTRIRLCDGTVGYVEQLCGVQAGKWGPIGSKRAP